MRQMHKLRQRTALTSLAAYNDRAAARNNLPRRRGPSLHIGLTPPIYNAATIYDSEGAIMTRRSIVHRRRSAELSFGLLARAVRGPATLVALFLAVSIAMGLPQSAAAADASVPVRPLAQAMATANHDPFPLVTANPAGEVRFALSEFSDGLVHFYTFMTAESSPVEFFVVWTPDNVVRTALNACDVCYRAKRGYHQDGVVVVCNNCGNRFPVGQVDAVNGGCNPTPLAARIDGSDLVISAADLTAGLAYFK